MAFSTGFEFYREHIWINGAPTANASGKPMGDWRWRLRASNGKVIADSGEGYRRAAEMVRTIRNNIINPGKVWDSIKGEAVSALERDMITALTRAGLDKDGRTLKRRIPSDPKPQGST